MLASREAVVDYMTPLGLHHLMAEGHHYGPGPWVDVRTRARRLDVGLLPPRRRGRHRLRSHRDRQRRRLALSLAAARAARRPARPAPRTCCSGSTTCPGTTACVVGADAVGRALPPLHRRRRRRPPDAGDLGRASRRSSTAPATATCAALLAIQEREARWWRNACLLYFQTFSRRPLPAGLEPLEGRSPTIVARLESIRSGRDVADERRHRARGQRVRERAVGDRHRRLRRSVLAGRGHPGRQLGDRAARRS